MRVTLKHGDEWQRKHARGFAKWYGEKYLPHINQELFLRIHILPYKDLENLGECECSDDDIDPRRFLITLCCVEDQQKKDFICAMAHEMVHLKQYALNELTDSEDAKHYVFMKTLYSLDVDYWEQPWEIEAHGRERGLMLKYAEYAGVANEICRPGYC